MENLMPELSVNPTVAEAPKQEDVKKSEEPVNLRPDLEFKSPSSGRVIRMGKPPEPTALYMPAVMSSMVDPITKETPDALSIGQQSINAKVTMFVRAIDSKPFRQPTSMSDVQMIIRELGEDDFDLVSDLFFMNFQPPSVSQLEIIKK
jgi:hypothetical protein